MVQVPAYSIFIFTYIGDSISIQLYQTHTPYVSQTIQIMPTKYCIKLHAFIGPPLKT